MKKRLAILLTLVFFVGCVKTIDEQGKKTWRLDPIKTEKVEKTIEEGASLIGALYPPALAAIIPLLGALGYWKTKIKPKFLEARTEANLYHASTHTLVQVVEDIKKNQPEIWKEIEPFLKSRIGTNTENVIRAMRGLPAKE